MNEKQRKAIQKAMKKRWRLYRKEKSVLKQRGKNIHETNFFEAQSVIIKPLIVKNNDEWKVKLQIEAKQ